MLDKLGDNIRLEHILDAIAEIDSYISNVDFISFSNNSMMTNATLRQLEVIGEACNKLSTELKSNNPQVEWHSIIGLRNLVAHEYFGIDLPMIWEIITTDLSELESQINSIAENIK